MLYQYCSELLDTGTSRINDALFEESEQIISCLETGVKARRLRSLKGVLFMVEMLGVRMKRIPDSESAKLFDNFTSYLFSNHNTALGMAVLKYAIANRRISIPRTGLGFQKVKELFSPVIVHDVKDADQVRRFERSMKVYGRLLAFTPISEDMKSTILTHY
jgi:hypothetical protein